VESVPQVVKADLPKDEAEKLKEEIAAAGGTVEIE
jgi:ribosomal protein L7/L12